MPAEAAALDSGSTTLDSGGTMDGVARQRGPRKPRSQGGPAPLVGIENRSPDQVGQGGEDASGAAVVGAEALLLEDELVQLELERARARQALREAAGDVEASERTLLLAVGEARRVGVTWGRIGELLGVSAQAVQQRYGRAGAAEGSEAGEAGER